MLTGGDRGTGAKGPGSDSLVGKLRDHPDLIIVNRPETTVAEKYRSLAVKLCEAENGKRTQMVVVTSAVPSDGKTLTALNLALAMAESRASPTLLMDGDLRRPALSRYLVPPTATGLAEVLSGSQPLEHALIRVDKTNLWVLPAGESVAGPLALFRRESLAPLCDELRKIFGQIVVDTPPVVPFSDASRIGTYSDGVLVVVRASKTTKSMLDRALEGLQGNRILGAVLTDTKHTPFDRYYYRYDYTNPYSERGASSK